MSDRVRQVVVAIGAAAAIIGAAWGSGAFGGTPIEDAADGALAADATLVAPASTAFSIWSVIYTGLALLAIVQALPSRASSPHYRSVAWWVLASMILNVAWIAVVQAGGLWLSVLVLLAIVAVLVGAARRLGAARDGNVLDLAATDVTVGLYLGWSIVASAANLAAVLDVQQRGVAILLIAAVVAVAMTFVFRLASRPAAVSVALAVAWGVMWIGIGRLDEPHSTPVAVTAFVAAALAAAAAVWRVSQDRSSSGIKATAASARKEVRGAL